MRRMISVPEALLMAGLLAVAQGSARADGSQAWREAVASRLRIGAAGADLPQGAAFTIRFTVGRDGKIVGVVVEGTSDPRAIAAARRIMARASPLPRPPTGRSVPMQLPIRSK